MGSGLLRRLTVPASESKLALVLAASLVVMALLLLAILWQSDVITHQRDLIRWLWNGGVAG
jgi:hypothetical protein